MSISRTIGFAALAIVTIVVITMSSQLFETNDAGYYQIKQAAGTGDMTVRTTPGIYNQMFGDIYTYKISDTYEFGGADAIPVRFNDAATATVGGSIRFKLSLNPTDILTLHQDMRSYDAVRQDLVRRVVEASLRQSASLYGAEEVYSSRKSDFVSMINQQIKDGIYATTYTESMKRDEDGNNFLKRSVVVARHENGKPVVAEPSVFDRYNIELIQLVINDPDFDEKTDELIAKRKEAEQERVVAKAKAERAKQDAITAAEQGKANVAIAEAEALVIKKKAVIEAEKAKEVAAQQALQAEEEKKAIIAKGEAEAESAKLKVAAGLTPLDKANIDKETAIGVAAELAKIQLPTTMVIGGGNGTQVNPFDAVGLESFMRISKDMAGQNVHEAR